MWNNKSTYASDTTYMSILVYVDDIIPRDQVWHFYPLLLAIFRLDFPWKI